MSHVDLEFTNDLTLNKGDLVLLQHNDAQGQAIRDRLATFKGEWFLDLQFGPDYRNDILVKNPRLDLVSSILKDEILKSIEGTGTFTEFDVTLDSDRKMTISYTVNTTDAVLSDTIII